ncbi:hypothetical protein H9W91_07430 [Streptomyces alfalfae]|uniref:hypothetical protein n=1 Tax=Streptomyces alfalfae TaxID=1642299 RepID=UPI001BA49D85|nr:hypothetical protein [Streptomyces alfalfae]QUI30710.1 hypothetical protein H9W91_07430 [Streptomyces alfalfae]
MLTYLPTDSTYGHEIAAWKVEFTQDVQDYTRQSYRHHLWDFEEVAEENGWARIGVVMDNLSPAESSTDQRYYGYNTARWAQGASNAEAIEEALNEAADGDGWAYGPGDTYVFDAGNPVIAAVVESLEGALSSYGYLNEERASELEDGENHPDDYTCHAGPDCGCYVQTHDHAEIFADAVDSGEIEADADEWHCLYCQEDRKITAADRKVMARIFARKWHEEIQAAGQMTVFMFVSE